MCREFGLVNSMIQTIWRNRTKILVRLNRTDREKKRFRKPERSDVDEGMFQWSKEDRRGNVPVRSLLLTMTFILPKF